MDWDRAKGVGGQEIVLSLSYTCSGKVDGRWRPHTVAGNFGVCQFGEWLYYLKTSLKLRETYFLVCIKICVCSFRLKRQRRQICHMELGYRLRPFQLLLPLYVMLCSHLNREYWEALLWRGNEVPFKVVECCEHLYSSTKFHFLS